MSYRTLFVEEVARRAEADIAIADRAVIEVLTALGERLRDVDAQAVATQLPASLAGPFLTAARRAAPPEPSFERRIARTDPRLVRAVCRLLAERLDEQARAHLRMQPLISLFA